MDGRYRENVQSGQQVDVVKKQDQGTGHLTDGVVERILTKSSFHPHGIKVRLESGVVGRIKKIYKS